MSRRYFQNFILYIFFQLWRLLPSQRVHDSIIGTLSSKQGSLLIDKLRRGPAKIFDLYPKMVPSTHLIYSTDKQKHSLTSFQSRELAKSSPTRNPKPSLVAVHYILGVKEPRK